MLSTINDEDAVVTISFMNSVNCESVISQIEEMDE